MTAMLKKHFSRLTSQDLLFREVTLVDREGVNPEIFGSIVELTRALITVDVPNGKFGSYRCLFRRDTGTQIGGSLRIDVARFKATNQPFAVSQAIQ